MGGQDASGDPAQQGHVLAAGPGGQGKRASHHPKRAAGRSRYTRPVSRPSRSAPSPPPAPPAACSTTPAPAPTRGRPSGPGRHLPPAQAQPQRRQHPHRRLPVLIPAAPPWRAPATAGDPADSPRATAGSRHHRPASAGPLSARCHRCPGERETGFAVFTGPAHPGGECHTCARRLGPNGVIE